MDPKPKPTSLPQPSKDTDSAATGRAQLDLLAADRELQKAAEQRIKEIEQGNVGACGGCEPPKKQ